MPDYKLRAVLDFVDKSQSGTQGAKRNLDGLGKAADGVKAALTGAAIIGVAKVVYEFSRLGAESIRTRRAFEAISGGAEAAAMNMDAMQRATRGAVSEQQMMASASQLMQMGLANNAQELENLVVMATRLGTAMGRDATQSIEEFALLLANQSIPRLDTFGISAGNVRSRILELQQATPGLTRELAFMQAVNEEGTKAMERLGDAVEDEALAFEQFEATMQDLKVAAAEVAAPAVAGFLELLVEGIGVIELLASANEQIEQAFQDQAQAATLTTGSYVEYVNVMLQAAVAAGDVHESQVDVMRDLLLFDEEASDVAETMGIYTRTQYMAAQATNEMEDATDGLTDAIAETEEKVLDANEALKASSKALRDADASTREYQLAQDALALALGETTIGEIAQREALQDVARQYSEGTLTVSEYVAKTLELQNAWLNMPTDVTTRYRVDVEGAPPSIIEAGPGQIAWQQRGTNYARGGLAIVGEFGPELVQLPRGSRVTTAYETRTMLNSGNTITNNRGGDTVVINDTKALALYNRQQRRDAMRQTRRAM